VLERNNMALDYVLLTNPYSSMHCLLLTVSMTPSHTVTANDALSDDRDQFRAILLGVGCQDRNDR